MCVCVCVWVCDRAACLRRAVSCTGAFGTTRQVLCCRAPFAPVWKRASLLPSPTRTPPPPHHKHMDHPAAAQPTHLLLQWIFRFLCHHCRAVVSREKHIPGRRVVHACGRSMHKGPARGAGGMQPWPHRTRQARSWSCSHTSQEASSAARESSTRAATWQRNARWQAPAGHAVRQGGTELRHRAPAAQAWRECGEGREPGAGARAHVLSDRPEASR
jgi:hypothetical protein